MNRNNVADRFGLRVSNFLSYGIVVFIKIDDFRNSWIFHGSHGDPMGPHGDPMGTPWGPHGDPMGPHGTPWDPMGTHGGPMGTHGNPWGPWIWDFRGGRGSGRQKPRLDDGSNNPICFDFTRTMVQKITSVLPPNNMPRKLKNFALGRSRSVFGARPILVFVGR